MNKARLTLGIVGTAAWLVAGAAQAQQLAPTPQKSPRTPVSKQLLAGKTAPTAVSGTVSGQAIVLDAERIRIDDVELRLFGVVPPLLGASFGPQARAVVDALAEGTVTCQVKDRSREGYYLAMCRNEQNADFGMELLRRGLAITARGSLRSSDYATAYIAAEQAAQDQKLGIWSVSQPNGATEKSIREAAVKAEALRAEAEAAKAELAKAEALKADAIKAAERAKAEAEAAMAAIPTTAVKMSTGETASTLPMPSIAPMTNEILAATSPAPLPTTAASVQETISAQQPLEMPKIEDERSFFEKYQLLLSGLLLFFTSLVITVGVLLAKAQQRKNDLRSVAAALRGEMMAARSICQARLSKIAHERTDKDTTWPRIRTTIFQAYVGKLGMLGAELSRQIASIYGMAADYASYYNNTEARPENVSKKQALEGLIHYIEEVTPKLVNIERSGHTPASHKPIPFTAAITAEPKPLSLGPSTMPTPPFPSGGSRQTHTVRPHQTEAQADLQADVTARLAEAKDEIVSNERKASPADDINHSDKEDEVRLRRTAAAASALRAQPQTNRTATARAAPQNQAKAQPRQQATGTRPASATAATAASAAAMAAKRAAAASAARSLATKTASAQKTTSTAQAAIDALSSLNLKAPIIERLSKLKTFAASQIENGKKPRLSPDEFTIPDYANLTEEELEALLYAEDDPFLSTSPKARNAG